MKTMLLVALGILLTTGCANDPIVDRHGLDEAKYQSDLAECRSYAEEVNTPAEVATKGAVGAAIGGAVGDHHTAGKGVGLGATVGGTQGFEEAERRKESVLYRCLKGRGYRVLG